MKSGIVWSAAARSLNKTQSTCEVLAMSLRVVVTAVLLFVVHCDLGEADGLRSAEQQTQVLTDLAFESDGTVARLRRWEEGTMSVTFNIGQRTATPNIDEFSTNELDDSVKRDIIYKVREVRSIVQDLTGIADNTRTLPRTGYGSFAVIFYSRYLFDPTSGKNPYLDQVLPVHLTHLNGRDYENDLAAICIGRTDLYDHPFQAGRFFEGAIHSGSLSVNLDRSVDEIATCTSRETLRLLGLQGHTKGLAHSIFLGQGVGIERPTEEDRETVRLLYLPQLTPGMTIPEVAKALAAP